MCHWGHHLVLGSRRDLGTVSCKTCLPVFILGASENFYLAMSLRLCMHVCTGLCVLVHTCVRLGISFADLIKLIMASISSLHYSLTKTVP